MKKITIIIMIVSLFCIVYSANLDLLINLVNFYNSNGEFQKALEQIEKGLKLDPENKDLLNLKDETLKNIKKAQKKEEEKVKEDKNIPSFKSKDDKTVDVKELIPEKKLKPFKFLSDIEKQKIDELQKRAITLKSMGKNFEASEVFREVLKYDKLDEESNFYLGVINAENKKFSEAEEFFNTVLMYNPGNIQAIYWMGLIRMKNRQFAEAKAYFKNVIEKDKRSILAYVQLANIYESTGDLGNAEKYYREALNVEPGLFNIYKSLSNLYLSAKMYSKAINVYREMIKQFPKNAYAYSGAALLFIMTGDYESSMGYYSTASKIDPENPEVLALSAMFKWYNNQAAEAEQLLNSALEKEPTNLKIYRIVTDSLYKRQDRTTSDKYAAMGLRYFPNDPVLNYIRGQIYIDTNNYSKSLPFLEKAYFSLKDKEIIHSLAVAYNKSGYLMDSIKKYKELVKRFSNDKQKDSWMEEARQVYEAYKKEREIQVETPQSGFEDNSYDYNIPQGF